MQGDSLVIGPEYSIITLARMIQYEPTKYATYMFCSNIAKSVCSEALDKFQSCAERICSYISAGDFVRVN